MRRVSRVINPLAVLATALACLIAAPQILFGTIVTTRSGMQLEGRVTKIAALNENPLNPSGTAGEVPNQPIVLIDDDLRRTFLWTMQVAAYGESPADSLERIHVWQNKAEAGRRVASVGDILGITKFDEFGRRVFSMRDERGRRIDVVQGITEVTPTYIRVEGLQVSSSYVWDMRLATTSIPPETLSKILRRQMNASDPGERLRVVRLFIQAQQYDQALLELGEVITDFPDLAHLKKEADRLRQLFAQKLVSEIEVRGAAGQHERAVALLDRFPTKGIAGETLLTVRDMLAEYEKRDAQYQQVLAALARLIGEIADEGLRASLHPIHEEIKAELSIHTLDRMADFLRFVDDATMEPDQKVALAVSGWLLGSGSAIDNLAVASSLVEVRNLARDYLRAKRPHEWELILDRMRSLEGGTPPYLARLIAHMKPPLDGEVKQLDTPGLFELTVKGIEQQPEFRYYLQLPPEYNPYRRYPCVVTLNGAGASELHQVDWWAGDYDEKTMTRQGQGARRGYIVIAPQWLKPHQTKYEFTFREHAAVLYCLRDAIRRAAIDTDRVFLSGHSIGGDAVWDIGLSHPDHWAGLIPVVANADRYVHKYSANGRGLPMYFVGGERDGGWLNKNGMELDRYLTSPGYDCTVVQYLGRGHEHFQDEVQRIFDWMELPSRRREFFPREINGLSMRPWDNYFWWFEIGDLPARSLALPGEGNERSVRPIKTRALALDNNRVSVTARSGRVTVWLSPELVDFDREVRVAVNGRDIRAEVQPNIQVLLEDVRTRGDRQHPFWAKVQWPDR